MTTTNNACFPKKEHLYGEIRIAELFKNGDKFLVHPIKVTFSKVEKEEENVRLLFSVPKRNFKSAVKRNRIKRLMKEAYRTQKKILADALQDKDFSLHIAFSFIASETPDYKTTYKKTTKILQKLNSLI